MGKQYNKVIKRRRRAAYIAKRKAAVKELVSKSGKSTKAKAVKAKPAKKPVAKKAKVVEAKPEPVAEKANPTDVLGDEEKKPTESVELKKEEQKSQDESENSSES